VAENGSHEALVFNAVPPDGILQAELMVRLKRFSILFYISIKKLNIFNPHFTPELFEAQSRDNS
jgi:hypothetical protein